jgi:hypothetical protein
VRLKGTGACSATITGGVTTAIAANPVPIISLKGGDASQNVILSTEIIAMTYTASHSATFTLSGGFPSGVSNNASGSSYTISGKPTVLGTYGYSLTASVNGCTDAAAGTITVILPPTTLCTQCCWNGATWVDCLVTSYPYPFNNSSPNRVSWTAIGDVYFPDASGPGSDKNGRANTAAISGSTVYLNAVQICKDLGTGWYLPAYEELVNMSAGTHADFPPLNGLQGANILTNYTIWSSSEYYRTSTDDRFGASSSTSYNVYAVSCSMGAPSAGPKSGDGRRVQCAWRE